MGKKRPILALRNYAMAPNSFYSHFMLIDPIQSVRIDKNKIAIIFFQSVAATDDYDVADTLANLSKIIDHYQRPLASRYVTSKGIVPQEPGSERDRQIRKLR